MDSPANVRNGPWTPRPTRRQLSAEQRAAMQRATLRRIEESPSLANFAAVIEEFASRGIPESEIQPKENCLTYNAWQAKGRQVRRGQHGVKITVYVPATPAKDAPPDAEATLRPVSATVFHVSQTDPKGA
jgi:hypothetical protein